MPKLFTCIPATMESPLPFTCTTDGDVVCGTAQYMYVVVYSGGLCTHKGLLNMHQIKALKEAIAET